jgi:hypothetical protein
MTQGLQGDKEIQLRQISSIQYRRAGLATNGYMQFTFMGGQETESGLFDATKDENTAKFNRGQQRSFDATKVAIEQRIAALQQPTALGSDLDQLEKLAALRDNGIIIEEEFQAKKKQLPGL